MARRSLGSLGALLLLLAAIPLVAAGHYRAAKLSWKKEEGNTAVFSLISTWSTEFTPYKEQVPGGVINVGDKIRVQGLGSPVLYFGDGAESLEIVVATCTAVDTIHQTWTGEAVIRHAYATADNSGAAWVAEFGGCCRDAAVSNRGDGYFSVTTNVDFGNGAMYSPKVANLPRGYMVQQSSDVANAFYMAGYDDGAHPNRSPAGSRNMTYALTSETGGAPRFTIDAATGLVSGGANAVAGLYFLKVRVSDTVSGIYSEMDMELKVVSGALPEYIKSLSQTRLPIPAVNELFSRYEYTFTLRFELTGAGSVGVQVASSARPAGATIPGVTTPVDRGGLTGYETDVNWLPTDAQVGWTIICVQATTDGTDGTAKLGSKQQCLDLDVLNDPPPQWVNPSNETTVVQVYMGEEMTVALRAQDDNLADDVNITGVNLPFNAVLSDVVKDNSVQINTVDRNFSWIPSVKAGGAQGRFCLRASDLIHPASESRDSSDVCFQYRVPKCLYRVRSNQALVDIAALFGSSWLQLWALNKHISRPEGYGVEGSISEGDMIHIGQLVLVKKGDSLEKIAARFGTTLRQMISLNADISPVQPLVSGQLVCLVPSSCTERAV